MDRIGLVLSLGTGLDQGLLQNNMLTRLAPNLSHFVQAMMTTLTEVDGVHAMCQELLGATGMYFRLTGPRVDTKRFPISTQGARLDEFVALVEQYFLRDADAGPMLTRIADRILALSLVMHFPSHHTCDGYNTTPNNNNTHDNNNNNNTPNNNNISQQQQQHHHHHHHHPPPSTPSFRVGQSFRAYLLPRTHPARERSPQHLLDTVAPDLRRSGLATRLSCPSFPAWHRPVSAFRIEPHHDGNPGPHNHNHNHNHITAGIRLTGESGTQEPWVFTTAATYKMEARIRGIYVVGSPATIEVQPAPLCPALSAVYGSLLLGGTVGTPRHLYVEPKDAYGNAAGIGREDTCLVVVRDLLREENVHYEAEMETRRAGVTVTVETGGEYAVHVGWRRRREGRMHRVGHSPFLMTFRSTDDDEDDEDDNDDNEEEYNDMSDMESDENEDENEDDTESDEE